MKLSVLLFAAVLIVGINGQGARLENFDIETVLKNDRILTNYIKCILDRGPCTREGRDLKKDLPEVRVNLFKKLPVILFSIIQTLNNACDDCSPKLKSQMNKLLNILETRKAADWKQIQARYDPTGELTKKLKLAVA